MATLYSSHSMVYSLSWIALEAGLFCKYKLASDHVYIPSSQIAAAALLGCDVEMLIKAKGLSDGDEVWLESPVRKIRGRVQLSQCSDPEVVGIAGRFGRWSPGMPIARDKGENFNFLLPTDLEKVEKISTALDHYVQVSLYISERSNTPEQRFEQR